MKKIGIGVLLVLVGLVVGWWAWPRPPIQPPTKPKNRLLWQFEAPQPGGFVASPTLQDGRLYGSALFARGFRYSGGVYAINTSTGKEAWFFNADSTMKPSASRAVVYQDKLFFGEGMHADFVCYFRCLDRISGKQLWQFEAQDHIEAAPLVQGETVYFSAGNDGVHALNIATGQPKWHFTADIHTDAQPCLVGGKLFIGTGPSRRFKTQQVIALNPANGEPLWRVPTHLPAWGSPVATSERVFVGLGNGRLMQSAQPPEVPAGALLCLRASNGEELWRVSTAEAVFQKPTLHRDRVYFASRDGLLRAVDQATGKVHFEKQVGSPLIASVVIVTDTLFTISVGGQLQAREVVNGELLWEYNFQEWLPGNVKPQFFGSPVVENGLLYLAGELVTPSGSLAVVYCLKTVL